MDIKKGCLWLLFVSGFLGLLLFVLMVVATYMSSH